MPNRQQYTEDTEEPQSKTSKAPLLDDLTIQRSICISEADTLSRQGQYAQAIPLYTKAITFKPNEQLYLCRARCRSFIGDLKGALEDTESLLLINSNSLKALLCKADILFAQGNFESALVSYHRGQQLKQDSEDFKSGKYLSYIYIYIYIYIYSNTT
jgi:tetratricopeptide (TPR) repeat protein